MAPPFFNTGRTYSALIDIHMKAMGSGSRCWRFLNQVVKVIKF